MTKGVQSLAMVCHFLVRFFPDRWMKEWRGRILKKIRTNGEKVSTICKNWYLGYVLTRHVTYFIFVSFLSLIIYIIIFIFFVVVKS